VARGEENWTDKRIDGVTLDELPGLMFNLYQLVQKWLIEEGSAIRSANRKLELTPGLCIQDNLVNY